MIDLHTHTLLSDGVLVPSELAQRAAAAGYTALGITDHADTGTLEAVVSSTLRVCADLAATLDYEVVPGVEITHVPPPLIPKTVERARQLGARLVVVHGESLVEPVAASTDRAAVEAGCDLLAHPGLIDEATVSLAAEAGTFLEISARAGHSLGNGHLVSLARRLGAIELLVVSSDAHRPGDLLTESSRRAVCRGAGLNGAESDQVGRNAEALLRRVTG